jgi:hypothetical protein
MAEDHGEFVALCSARLVGAGRPSASRATIAPAAGRERLRWGR